MPESALTSSTRKQWLDAIKGVAIILVIMSHTQSGIPRLHSYLVACYMPLFFIASGYVFKAKAGGYHRKWKQLLTPYINWAIIYLFVACITHHITDIEKIGQWIAGIVYSRYNLFEMGTIPNIKLLPPGAKSLWFLTCMALSYLLVRPLIQVKPTMTVLLIIVYLGISAGFTLCPILMPWSLDTAFMGALFIYTGYLLRNFQLNTKQVWITFLVCAPIYLVLVRINGGINMSIREYGNLGLISLPLFGLIGILGTVSYATFFILTNNTWLCRFFAYFGRISLTILCAHMLFVNIIKQVMAHISNQGAVIPNAIFRPTQLVIILLLCILTHNILNHLKAAFRKNQQ